MPVETQVKQVINKKIKALMDRIIPALCVYFCPLFINWVFATRKYPQLARSKRLIKVPESQLGHLFC